MGIEETIRNFIVETFIFEPGQENFDNTQSFLETGIIDSTGMLELVSFIEETYNIKMADEELIPANLDSVNNVVGYIQRKLQNSLQLTVDS
jgi:acyl carrier protein